VKDDDGGRKMQDGRINNNWKHRVEKRGVRARQCLTASESEKLCVGTFEVKCLSVAGKR
jgi:hypothetical protein